MKRIRKLSAQKAQKIPGEPGIFILVCEIQSVCELFLENCENDASEIVILEVEPVDEETENYLSVQDENILNAVYAIFKEKFADTLDFAD